MTDDARVIDIGPGLRLPWAELEFRATRASGPGGQHVNRSATRIELWWDLMASPALTEAQRSLLADRLGHRLDRAGRLRLVSGERRSQTQNRDAAVARLQALVAAALRPRKPRKATRPTRASVERRIEGKKRRGSLKRGRRKPGAEDA